MSSDIARRGFCVLTQSTFSNRTSGKAKAKGKGLITLAVGAAVGVMLSGPTRTYAANATWTGLGDGTWIDVNDWNPAAPPGDASGTNPDTATFNNNVNTAVTIDSGRNVA